MEPNIIYSTLEINEFCRVCLKKSPNKHSVWDTILLKNIGNIQFVEMIMECTSVIVYKDDGFPEYICSDCTQQLENAYCFKHRCEKSDSKLKQIFEILKTSGETYKYILIENSSNISDLKNENENQENELEITEEIMQNEDELLVDEKITPKTEEFCEVEENYLDANDAEDFAAELNTNITLKSDEIDVPESNENVLNNSVEIKSKLKMSVNDFSSANTSCLYCLRKFRSKKNRFIHERYCAKRTSTGKENYLNVNKLEDVESESTEDVTPEPNENVKIPIKIESKLETSVSDFSSAIACPYCSRKFKSKTNLTLHENYCKKETFNCDQCSKTFPSQALLNIHLSTSHGEVPAPFLTCDICNADFKDKSSLIEHFYMHIETALYFNCDFDDKTETCLCYACDKNFSSAKELIKHCSEHDQNKDYRCRKCTEAFDEYGLLRNHIRDHGILPYFCDKCLLNFDSVRKKKLHQKAQHLGPMVKETFKCPLCEIVFNDLFKLKNHLREHKADLYKCLQCSESYNSLAQLSNHKKEHNVCNLCPDCGKQFARASSLYQHIRVHHMKMTQVTCDVCNKTYHSPTSLKVHKRIHTKEKPYICSYCPYRSRQTSDLYKHIRTHTGEKPYACRVANCAQTFKTSSQLYEHSRQHTGERNYECTICKKKFVLSKILRTHMLIHSDKREHKCDICTKQFRRKYHLTIHKLKVHDILNVKRNKTILDGN